MLMYIVLISHLKLRASFNFSEVIINVERLLIVYMLLNSFDQTCLFSTMNNHDFIFWGEDLGELGEKEAMLRCACHYYSMFRHNNFASLFKFLLYNISY